MKNKKQNHSMKTYKMAVPFKLNHADIPPLFHILLHESLFPIKLVFFRLNFLLKLVMNLFLGPLAFVMETLLLSIFTILPNRSYLILL